MSNIKKTKEEWDAIYAEERKQSEDGLLTRAEYETLVEQLVQQRKSLKGCMSLT